MSVGGLIRICLILLVYNSCCLLLPLQALPLCDDNRHIAGEWTKSATITTKSFHCCGRDNNDYLYNTTVCPLPPPTSPPSAVTSSSNSTVVEVLQGTDGQTPLVGYDACQCDRRDNKRDTISSREKYMWVPTYCDVKAFDAVDFCRQLGSRTVLFAGDSSMLQITESLLAMLQQGLQGQTYTTVHNCMHQLVYHRTDVVTSSAHKSNKLDLFEVVARHQPNIAFFSVGIHFNDLTAMINVWDKLPSQLTMLKRMFPNMKLFWRSQLPNFVTCRDTKAKQPLLVFPPQVFPADQIPAERLPMVLDDYVQQQVLSTRAPQSDMMRVNYLDISPLLLRPDALTSDCNHFCLPGPLNLIPALIYNMLLTKEL